MRAIVYHGPGRKSWDEVSKPSIQEDLDAVVRVDAVTICGTDLHILKGDVPDGDGGSDPRPRGGRHDRGDRLGRDHGRSRRPGAHLLHHRVRALPILQGGPIRTVHRRWELDPRTPDRRDPGRVRPGPLRGHVHPPRARRRFGRSRADARRHLPHELRGRGAERQGPAGRHRGGGRDWADRTRSDPHGAAVLAEPDRGDRHR